MQSNTDKLHSSRVQSYYKIHSRIYDLSRWTFLFGRHKILEKLPPLPDRPNILEIGCGTGRNMIHLEQKFSGANITGLDLSTDMLKVARKKLGGSKQICLINADYFSNDLELGSFDLILLSYSLTMFGNQPADVLERISQNLKPNGYLAAVDFNTTPFDWFRQWMEINHVNFSGEYLPLLQKNFHSVEKEVNNVYLGLWNYFLFIGRRKQL